MVKIIDLRSIVPLLSIMILMLGNGLYTTIISLRLKDAGESDVLIGAITSIYYLGMLVGSFNLSSVIMKIGHIRSFAGFASVLAVATIMPGMSDNIVLWFASRLVAGYSLAGLYISTESWLIDISNNDNRGRYMAVYMIMLYMGQSAGQLFLNITDYKTMMPFCVASTLTVIAIIPIAIVASHAPRLEKVKALSFKELYKISPTGVIGCGISGVLIASLYGLLPVSLKTLGYSVDDIALLVAIVIAGGVILQYPLGHVSDFIDRRVVLIALCFFAIAVSIALIIFGQFFSNNFLITSILFFTLGGLVFTIYPICMNHTCDFINPSHVISAAQGMLLSYGIGSVIGPIVIAYCMDLMGAYGLFMAFTIFILFLCLFTIIRIVESKKAIEATNRLFKSDPCTTPISPELYIGIKKNSGK